MIGSTLATLAVDAGYEVVLSNSRGPDTLAELAAVNKMPTAPRAMAALPALFPGTRPNSETASALVNATSADAARTWWITAGWVGLPSRGATEIATNSSPIRPAAQVAEAANNSR